jgi:tRNA nucleotidyltransferase (CCA-adding enzyme)
MGLLDAFDIGDVKNVCKKFVFCKGEEKRILSYKNISHKIMSVLGLKKVRSSLIFNLLEPLSYEVIILIKARYKNKCVQRHIEDFFEIYNGMRILISGHDLHKLGIAPGPYYQKIFSRVLKAKLEGEVRTRQEELELIRKLVVS